MDVTIVTYEKYPALPPDDVIFRDALERCGASVRAAVWSDARVDWSQTAVAVVRATWDYPQGFAEFGDWLDRVEASTRLVNDVATVRWNAHKRYLADLERRGIAIVPTIFVDGGAEADAAALCAQRAWDDVVMKPCVGGSSFLASRFSGPAIAGAGCEHLRELLARGDAMIQPYLTQIESEDERAIIVIDGRITHAVAKAMFNSSTETTTERPHEPTAQERKFVEDVLAASGTTPAYAHGPLLLELELIEPTLYFSFAPAAAERLAQAVLR